MADDRRFVEPVAEDFECGVCSEVMRNPVSGCKEGHNFCFECVKDLDRCPVCRATYNIGFMKNRPVDNYIQALTVLCKYGPDRERQEKEKEEAERERQAKRSKIAVAQSKSRLATLTASLLKKAVNEERGAAEENKKHVEQSEKADSNTDSSSDLPVFHCTWRGPLSALQQHLNTTCLFQPSPCKYSAQGCQITVKRRSLSEHEEQCEYRPQQCEGCKRDFPFRDMERHVEECEETVMRCPLCEEGVRRKDLGTHMAEVCAEMEIECELAGVGCKEKMKRKHADKHASEYAVRHVALMGAEMKRVAGMREEWRKEKEAMAKMRGELEQMKQEREKKRQKKEHDKQNAEMEKEKKVMDIRKQQEMRRDTDAARRAMHRNPAPPSRSVTILHDHAPYHPRSFSPPPPSPLPSPHPQPHHYHHSGPESGLPYSCLSPSRYSPFASWWNAGSDDEDEEY